MKRILYMLCAALLIVACGNKNGDKNLTLEEKLCTEWHSEALSVDGDVYLHFEIDKTFEIYQRIGEGAYRLYRGTWNLEENLLTGKYNDGEDWAAGYSIEINGNTLTMTSLNDAAEVTVYTKTAIPESVKNGSETIVKSI